jgi:hypothetical protein
MANPVLSADIFFGEAVEEHSRNKQSYPRLIFPNMLH